MMRKALFIVCCVFLFFVIHQSLQQPQNQQNETNDDATELNPNFTILDASTEVHHVDRVSYRKCRKYKNVFEDDIKKALEVETTTEIEESTEMLIEIPKNNGEIIDLYGDSDDEGVEIEKSADNTGAIKENIEIETNTRWKYFGIPVIAGGETTALGEFPHMAAIGWKNADGSYNFDCGGAVISPQFVLTAAHCTYSHGADNPVPKVVVVGDQNIDSAVIDGASPIQIEIKKIHKHPEYTRKKNYNDIALLELDIDEVLKVLMYPACLWTSKDLGEIDSAIATGWGVTDPYKETRSKELQKVSLPILSNEVCNGILSNHINRKWEKGFLDTQLCAGVINGGKDTCPGDSGSPLQVSTEEYLGYVVIGITSFGPRFCNQLPAVYTRVSSYLDWIESIVWPNEYQQWLNETKMT